MGGYHGKLRASPTCSKTHAFSYTLPAWVPYLAAGTAFICVFREPQRTVNSIMRNIRDERYLRDLAMAPERACRYWEAVYRSVFEPVPGYRRLLAVGALQCSC